MIAKLQITDKNAFCSISFCKHAGHVQPIKGLK